jgi:phosphatidylserine synthase
MSVWGWSFVVLNIVVCVGCLWSTTWNYNALGERERWNNPGNWIWAWQLLGVVLVVSLKVSAWHLIWWYIVGYIVCGLLGKLLWRWGLYNP